MNKPKVKWFSWVFIALGVFILALVGTSTYLSFKHDKLLASKSQADRYVHYYFDVSSSLVEANEKAQNYFRNGQRPEDRSWLINYIQLAQMGIEYTKIFDEPTLALVESRVEDLEVDREFFASVAANLDSAIDSLLDPNQNHYWVGQMLNEQAVTSFERAERMLTASEAVYEVFYTQILRGSKVFVALNFTTLVFSILGMAYFMYLNLQNDKFKQENLAYLAKVESSSKAKSRLLSMLSHELRTPLNGVLGLVSLGIQSKKAPQDRKLLEQIQSSAMDLHRFLEDVLNFSALEKDGKMARDKILFQPIFALRLREKLEAVSRKYGVSFEVEHTDEHLGALKADKERIFQSLFYAFSFIIKNTLQNRVICETCVEGERWFWKVDLDMNESEGTKWQAEALVGGEKNSDDHIESDTLETTMLRGLMEVIGGDIRLISSKRASSRYRLIMSFPVSNTNLQKLDIIDFSEGQNLTSWMKMMLGQLEHRFCDKADLKNATIALVDTSTSDELDLIKVIRRAAPDIFIIGVGETEHPELYDSHVRRSIFSRKFQVNVV